MVTSLSSIRLSWRAETVVAVGVLNLVLILFAHVQAVAPDYVAQRSKETGAAVPSESGYVHQKIQVRDVDLSTLLRPARSGSASTNFW